MYTLSIYTHIFERNGKFFLYNAETCYFSEITSTFYQVLKDCRWNDIPKSLFAEILKRRIVVLESKKYDYYYSSLIDYNASSYSDSFLNLIIAPTTDCNFACPYCFEPKNNPRAINLRTEEKIIEYIKNFSR